MGLGFEVSMLCSRCIGYEYGFVGSFWVGTNIVLGWLGFGNGFTGNWLRFGTLVFKEYVEMGRGV